LPKKSGGAKPIVHYITNGLPCGLAIVTARLLALPHRTEQDLLMNATQRTAIFFFAVVLGLLSTSAALANAPTAPHSLTVLRASDSSVFLSWQASQDDNMVSGYNVYRRDVIKGERLVSSVVNTRLSDIQLAPGIEYTYYVVAFDGDGNLSPRSSEVTAAGYPGDTTATPPPVTPLPNDSPTPGDPPTPTPVEPTPTTSPTDPLTDSPLTEPPSTEPMVPDVDFTAPPRPSPDPADPFGSALELDLEASVGGIPTTPKNLRIDLVSNDWAEFSWAPANDDGEIVAYNIYRSDGHVYVVGRDQSDSNAGVQAEIDKFFRTTSFIDCNYTRFFDRIHFCADNAPSPGSSFDYQVTAVDNDGNESQASNSIQIDYHAAENAPIPLYDDFYKLPDDIFAQLNDLSRTAFFLDEFDLVFEDEFNGPVVDANKWQTQLTWGDTRIINGEQQYFVHTQAEDSIPVNPFRFGQAATGESTLTIESVPLPQEFSDELPPVCFEPDPFNVERCQFLSGALSSHDRFGITYGYIEGRMKVSDAFGALSSFYMYHRYAGLDNLRHAPEIDIVEYLGENPFGDEDAFQTYHFADVVSGDTRSSPTMGFKNPDDERYSERFHTFSVLWEPQLVIWYIDGKEIKRLTGPQVSRQQMNIVTYLVAGSGWAPTPDASSSDTFPLSFEIDYIRAYQRPVYRGNGVYPEE